MSNKKKSTMEFDFKQVDNDKLSKECDYIIKEFETLLDDLGQKHIKKKMLWRQIFENAIIDRRNAFIMFNNLYLEVHGSSDQHALHGQNLTKYLERMSKANEQIIKLSELVNDAITLEEVEDEHMGEQDMYDHLEAANLEKKNKK